MHLDFKQQHKSYIKQHIDQKVIIQHNNNNKIEDKNHQLSEIKILKVLCP